MTTRRDVLLDAAIEVLGGKGTRALTHRAVDAEAGLPSGSTANYFPTRDALLQAIVARVSERERRPVDEIAADSRPTTPGDLGKLIAGYAIEAVSTSRALTAARYAILIDAVTNPGIREGVGETAGQVNAWFTNLLRQAGSADPQRDLDVLANYVTGLVLHNLARPSLDFDPTERIAVLIRALTRDVAESAEEDSP